MGYLMEFSEKPKNRLLFALFSYEQEEIMNLKLYLLHFYSNAWIW